MLNMLEGGEFYFGKVLGKLFSLIGIENGSCGDGGDGIMGVLALVINAIFVLVSLGLFAKIVIDIFKGSKDEGEMEDHIQKWKDNFKKNIIPLIGASIFVIMGVVLKGNGCSGE